MHRWQPIHKWVIQSQDLESVANTTQHARGGEQRAAIDALVNISEVAFDMAAVVKSVCEDADQKLRKDVEGPCKDQTQRGVDVVSVIESIWHALPQNRRRNEGYRIWAYAEGGER